MVYISYFGKMKSFPPNMIPIAICGGIPKWFNEHGYKCEEWKV